MVSIVLFGHDCAPAATATAEAADAAIAKERAAKRVPLSPEQATCDAKVNEVFRATQSARNAFLG
jgi:hypothetical protein